MAKSIKTWLGYEFSSGTTTGKDYKDFQKDAKADLVRQCAKCGLKLHHFYPNHYEFSAVLRELTTGNFVYINISDTRLNQDEWYFRVLIRKMEHEKDWIGKKNHFCNWNDIGKMAKQLAA